MPSWREDHRLRHVVPPILVAFFLLAPKIQFVHNSLCKGNRREVFFDDVLVVFRGTAPTVDFDAHLNNMAMSNLF